MNKDLANQAKLTTRQVQNVRSKLAKSASQVGNRLIAAALGEIEISATSLKAAQIIMDKTTPSLQSVDSTVMQAEAGMTEEQAMERLGALLTKYPGIADIIRGKGVTVDPDTERLSEDIGTSDSLDSDRMPGEDPSSESVLSTDSTETDSMHVQPTDGG